jgi:SAM-dependent methyltransferase
MSHAVFDAYAAYYDLLNRDKDYEAEAAYVDALLQRHRPGTARLLELGCGTGLHAERLARRGYSVLGVDRSAEMVARANARRQSLPAETRQRMEFVIGDVQDVRIGRTFDAVISLFHVFSYQTTNATLRAAVATAAAHLARGGLLCFDYWYGPAVLAQRPEHRVRRMEDAHCVVERVAEPELDDAANTVRVRYGIDVRSKSDGTQHRFDEVHDMRYLFLPEIQAMAMPEFRVRAHQCWMGDAPPSAHDWAAVSTLERLA